MNLQSKINSQTINISAVGVTVNAPNINMLNCSTMYTVSAVINLSSSTGTYPACGVRPANVVISTINGAFSNDFSALPTGINWGLSSDAKTVSGVFNSSFPADPLGTNYTFNLIYTTPPLPNPLSPINLDLKVSVSRAICGTSSATPNISPTVINGVVTTCIALPIILAEFIAKNYEESVLLNWKTESETNFSHFEVEKSISGDQFAFIARVNGNSYENAYSHLDRDPHNGINYYRLKMVDTDGTYVYSEIKAVEMLSKGSKEIDLFPNPFTGGFTLRGLAKESTVKVYDSKGTLIFDQKTDDSVFRVDMSNIKFGLYNAVINSGGTTVSKNIIKVD